MSAFLPPIVSAFQSDGWRVSLASGPGPGLDEAASHMGVEKHEVPLVRGVSPWSLVLSVVTLIQVLRRERPAVLLCATPVASLVGALAGRVVPGVVVVHMGWGLRSESMRYPGRLAFAAMEHLTVLLAHSTVANSRSLATVMNRRWPRVKQVAVLGQGSSHGVDLQRFRFAPPRNDEEVVLGFVGRLRRDKGIVELLTAAQRLTELGHSFRLVLLGDVEEHDLVALIEQTPNTKLFSFDRDVPRFMRAVDVLVLPSWREGFPNVVLEASASGRPVVTTRATGARDSVVDGVTGMLVEPKDAEGLTAALSTMINDFELRKVMGEAGRAWVERNFEESAVCELLVSYVRTVWRAA